MSFIIAKTTLSYDHLAFIIKISMSIESLYLKGTHAIFMQLVLCRQHCIIRV